MRDFDFLESMAYRTFVFPDGRMCDVMSCRYDCKVDLSCMKYIPVSCREEYSSSSLPTMEELVKCGVVKVMSCISVSCEVSFYNGLPSFPTDLEFAEHVVSSFLSSHGVVVSVDAVLHNLDAWRSDFKSGYRDEANGYHLFSPCGCNPLSFRYNSLHELCEDWQQTYVC